MPEPQARYDLLGGLSAAIAAVAFGTIIIWGRFVLERGIPVETMLAIRFGIGALVLGAAIVLTQRSLLAEPGERPRLVVLGVFGYAIEASMFFTAAQHGTVATVTLLFFVYPVWVMLWARAFGGRGTTGLSLVALVCALVGTAVVVGTGTGLSIDRVGVVLALLTSLAYSGYLTGADLWIRRTNALTAAMWVSAGASAGLFVWANVVGHWVVPSGAAEWGPLVGMGLASGAAFFFLMDALNRIGAVRTAIISAMEPLAAAVLGFWFLEESVTVTVAVGGALILVGSVLASLARAPTPQEQQIP